MKMKIWKFIKSNKGFLILVIIGVVLFDLWFSYRIISPLKHCPWFGWDEPSKKCTEAIFISDVSGPIILIFLFVLGKIFRLSVKKTLLALALGLVVMPMMIGVLVSFYIFISDSIQTAKYNKVRHKATIDYEHILIEDNAIVTVSEMQDDEYIVSVSYPMTVTDVVDAKSLPFVTSYKSDFNSLLKSKIGDDLTSEGYAPCGVEKVSNEHWVVAENIDDLKLDTAYKYGITSDYLVSTLEPGTQYYLSGIAIVGDTFNDTPCSLSDPIAKKIITDWSDTKIKLRLLEE